MKQIVVLGSTGSIGKNTLDVVRNNKDLFKVNAITTNKNIDELTKQIELFNPSRVVICDRKAYDEFVEKKLSLSVDVLYGNEALLEVVRDKSVDMVVNALTGFVGLLPTIEGITHRKDIAIANKETIVVGGKLVTDMARFYKVNLVPIDSEHNAILFLLQCSKKEHVNKLIITASGGPFRNLSRDKFKDVTVSQALCHPTWDSMGMKITVDSSTLLNKGFEVIEAHYLFDFPLDSIDVMIHGESVVHSMIETVDGALYAQLGPKDMRLPIQNAMTYPDVLENNYDKLNLCDIGTLTFSRPDFDKFPLLGLAYEVGAKKGTMPAVLNASNEIAVYAFLDNEIAYTDIFNLISSCLLEHKSINSPVLEDIIKADKWAREYSKNLIKEMKKALS